jgi:4-hydroxymandelate oxidase
VSRVEVATSVLGEQLALPVMVAPSGRHGLAHPEAEVATARGAAAAGSLMILSSFSSLPLEDVAAAGARWFQLYVYPDRSFTRDLVDRAKAAGYSALVVTVDTAATPRLKYGLGELRRGLPTALPGETLTGLPAPAAMPDPALTGRDLEWLRDFAGLPVVVKGVLRGDDARECVEAGAAAIVVSNHGGRTLDGALATADALPEIVEAVAGRLEVYVDGGVRTGADVVRALALGARAVLIGRPPIWALALGGAAGVQNLLEGFRADLIRTLSFCGCASLEEVGPDLVVRVPG